MMITELVTLTARRYVVGLSLPDHSREVKEIRKAHDAYYIYYKDRTHTTRVHFAAVESTTEVD